MSRKMIAALQLSLDGYTQGEDRGETSWVDSWADALELVPDVDAFVQGAGMYPGYAEYWSAIEANPHASPPFQARLPYEREVAYARRAARTPHYVLSRKLERVSWPPTATIVRDVADLRALKDRPGKNLYVVGGPTLVSSLLNEGLLDELKLVVSPLLLGAGRPMFAGVRGRRSLRLLQAEPTGAGKAVLTFGAEPPAP
jgi:dihydrofolate reductase